MKVILQQDVRNLGDMGDIVRVKDGYARNYLLPRGLAIIANEKKYSSIGTLKENGGSQSRKRASSIS